MIDPESAVSFKIFATNVATAIQKYGNLNEETLLVRQHRQIQTLINLEKDFRLLLLEHKDGTAAFEYFVDFILYNKRNILIARPYFRERQEVFSSNISIALQEKRVEVLYDYNFNYSFIKLVVKKFKWSKKSKLMKIVSKIERLRTEIVEMNLPLAISQARQFWHNTPRNHLSFMDLVQIHCGGLLIAVDKFVPPNTKGMTLEQELQAYRSFRAVAIGRMIGDRISNYSETLLHFFPIDRRKIYRANKIMRFMGSNPDYTKVSEFVNLEIKDVRHKTNAAEIRELLAGASCVSGDSSIEEDGETTLDVYIENDYESPELKAETLDALYTMKREIEVLPIFDQKFLKLKGI